jgi:two-component system nitrogen regulation response regulator GlnG
VVAPGREIRLSDLPPELGPATSGETALSWPEALARWAGQRLDADGAPLLEAAMPEFERTLIRTAMARSGGHRQEAARRLGWGRNTLARKIRELGLDDL